MSSTPSDVLTAPFTATDTSGVVLEIVDKTAERDLSITRHNAFAAAREKENKEALKKDPNAKTKPSIKRASEETGPLYADNVELIIAHCSATSATKTGADINQMHLANGWAGCGYHYVVVPQDDPPKTKMVDGVEKQIVKVEMWRDPHGKNNVGDKGAHASELNPYAVGVCWIGEEEAPTLAQRQAFKLITQKLQSDFPNAVVTGHRDCGAPKTCPNFDTAQLWKAENAEMAAKNPERFPDQNWSVAAVLAKRAERMNAKKGKAEDNAPATVEETKPAPQETAEEMKPAKNKTAEPKDEKPKDKPPEKKSLFTPWKGSFPGWRKTTQDDHTPKPAHPVASAIDYVGRGAEYTIAMLLSPRLEPPGDPELQTTDEARRNAINALAKSSGLMVNPLGAPPRTPSQVADPTVERVVR